MNRVRFTREARSELLAQTAYYETIRQGLGARFRAEVEKTTQLAAAFPHHGKPAPGGTRRRIVAVFPFKIFYTATDDGVLVHAVAGDHQLPGYWLHRVADSDG